jgi:prepilin-type N-terminal cleavage/methylation domain-containing protein
MSRKTDNYTMIEILVVLMLVGILAALGIGALNSVKSGGGVSGTVRMLSSQLSLGRSYAVSRNYFVAVLLPDDQVTDEGINNDKTTGFNGTDGNRLFRQSRLCYVNVEDGKYKFSSWIGDSSWVKWSEGVLVCASSNYNQVVDIDHVSGKNSAAVVFANSGALTHSNIPRIQVFRARYDFAKNKLIYTTKERKDTGWEISINPFTGRTSYDKKHE